MNNILSRALPLFFTFFLLVFMNGVGFAQDETGVHRRLEDAEKWAGVFEKPEPDAWQKPDELIHSHT